MWDLDYKESWAPKNWCFWTVVLEKILESPLDYKEILPVNPKGDQSWTFTGRTDAEAETPIFWPPDEKYWLIGKDSDAGKDWRQEKKGMTEDEMVGWHHRFDGHEFEQAPGVGDGQGGLVCCSPWSHKGSDTTEKMNWTELTLLLGRQCQSWVKLQDTQLVSQIAWWGKSHHRPPPPIWHLASKCWSALGIWEYERQEENWSFLKQGFFLFFLRYPVVKFYNFFLWLLIACTTPTVEPVFQMLSKHCF